LLGQAHGLANEPLGQRAAPAADDHAGTRQAPSHLRRDVTSMGLGHVREGERLIEPLVVTDQEVRERCGQRSAQAVVARVRGCGQRSLHLGLARRGLSGQNLDLRGPVQRDRQVRVRAELLEYGDRSSDV